MKIEITEKNKYNTRDIAKWIRQTLKKYPDLKISVTSEVKSISIAIMENKKIRFVKKFEEIPEEEILSLANARNRTKEETIEFIKQIINSKHNDVNHYHIDTDWSLTDEGKKILKEIKEIAQKHNWDNSDPMTDYFDVNYYLNISLGKWDKPFKDGE